MMSICWGRWVISPDQYTFPIIFQISQNKSNKESALPSKDHGTEVVTLLDFQVLQWDGAKKLLTYFPTMLLGSEPLQAFSP